MRRASQEDFGSDTRTLSNSLGGAIKILEELAGPASRVKEAITEAARRTGFSYTRTSDIWYGKARRIEDFEREALVAARDKKRREVARNELHDIKKRIAILEARLSQTDAEFHRETLDALGDIARGVGGQAARRG